MPRRHNYRVPKGKPGQLRILYTIAEPGDKPDIVYDRGDSVPRCDAHLLHGVMGSKRPGQEFPSGEFKWEPALFDELKERGYDITTLRFEIYKTGMKPPRKKPKPGPCNIFTIFWKNGVREVITGFGSNLKEAFEYAGRTESEGAIFHWAFGNNRKFVWDDIKNEWTENHRPVPSWESK